MVKLKSLSPEIELEDFQKPYLEAMIEAIKCERNKNIALTGPYGSGKSTIINAFLKRYNYEEKTLRVSISKFAISKKTDDKDKGANHVENELEQQILRQMIYTVDPKSIPQSNFKRIIPLENSKLLEITILIVFYLILNIFMFKFNYLDEFKNIFILEETQYWLLTFAIGTVWIILTIWLLLLFTKIISNLKALKLVFGGNQIEYTSNKDVRVFDKYLDEIIYYFNNVDYEILVLEDLDRFENIEIFERLRNLNILINESLKTQNRKIVFLYALRDDIFSNGEENDGKLSRTKFFDIIIPTMKIINNSNSEEKFYDLLGDEIRDSLISREMIRGISYYINDMRLLINITNEYRILKKVNNNININNSKLFAISVYKNFYPKDYTFLLDLKEESVFLKVIKKKEEIISEKPESSSSKLSKVILNNSNKFENFFSSEENYLLKYLFINDWIDDNYNDYLTYYYEGVLNAQELNYLKMVGRNEEIDFKYNTPNVRDVMLKIFEDSFNIKYFTRDILTYIFNDIQILIEDGNSEKARRIKRYVFENITAIRNKMSRDIKEKETRELLKKILLDKESEEEHLWIEVKDSNVVEFIKIIIDTVSEGRIKVMQDEIKFDMKKEIEKANDFLNWEINFDDNLYNKLKIINVKLKHLEYIKQNQVNEIIDYRLYSINIDTFRKLFNQELVSYKLIKSDEEIKTYAVENIQETVNSLLAQSEYEEPESTFVELLTLVKSEETIEKLVLKNNNMIGDIEYLIDNKKVLKLLSTNNMIGINDQNIKKMLNDKEYYSDVIKLIIRNLNEVDNLLLETQKEVIEKTIYHESMAEEYLDDLKILPFSEVTYNLGDLKPEKQLFLIENNYLQEDDLYLKYLKKTDESLLLKYLNNHKQAIIDNETSLELSTDLFLKMIPNFSIQDRSNILENQIDQCKNEMVFKDIIEDVPLDKVLEYVEWVDLSSHKEVFIDRLIKDGEIKGNILKEKVCQMIEYSNLKKNYINLINIILGSFKINEEIIKSMFEKVESDTGLTNETLLLLLEHKIDSVDFWGWMPTDLKKLNDEVLLELIKFAPGEFITNLERKDFLEKAIEVSKIIINSEKEVDKLILENLIIYIEEEKIVAELILKWLVTYRNHISTEEYLTILRSVKTDHKKLVEERKRNQRIHYNTENKKLIQYLQSIELIASFKKNSTEYIEFNNKYEIKIEKH